jgi:hypothetical protein
MDFSLHGKVTARQAILDRERAVATARNPALSKYGSTLMAIGLKRNQNWSKQSIDNLETQATLGTREIDNLETQATLGTRQIDNLETQATLSISLVPNVACVSRLSISLVPNVACVSRLSISLVPNVACVSRLSISLLIESSPSTVLSVNEDMKEKNPHKSEKIHCYLIYEYFVTVKLFCVSS